MATESKHYGTCAVADTPSPVTATTTIALDNILETASKKLQNLGLLQEFVLASKSYRDPASWTKFMAKLETTFHLEMESDERRATIQEVLEMLVLHTFRNKLQLPRIFDADQTCLRWLCQLYMGLRPLDDQMKNLPYPVALETDTLTRVQYMWGHLMALTDTLAELREFYAVDCVHLLSRAASQVHLRETGDYLFRMSNLEVRRGVFFSLSWVD
jgi:hypothetical protein